MAGTVTAMFLLVMIILITSFQIAIYGDSEYRFYEKEYRKYRVTEDLHMSMENVMKVTDYMMDYLIGREEVLSVKTEVDGRRQDFFNEQDRLHMADVRKLFLGGLKIRNFLVVFVAALFLLSLSWKNRKEGQKKRDIGNQCFRAYSISLVVFLLAITLLAVAVSVDFTACFTLFHELFFSNDLWLFDPAEDFMIRMLPEGLFYDMAFRVGSLFAGILVILFLLSLYMRWRENSRKVKEKTGKKKND